MVLALSVVPATLPGLATPAAAQPAKPGPGATAVKTANDTIAKLLKAKAPASQVTASVSAFLDIDQLGKSAMVNQWAKLKPTEQTDFLKLLRDLMNANYVNAQQNNLQYTVVYLGESTNKDGHIVVNTTVTAPNNKTGRPTTITVDYVLVKNGNTLRAFDVITGGAGLVENYRQIFDRVMKSKGFTGLMSMMNDKLAQIQKAAPTGGSRTTPSPTSPTTGPAPAKKT